MSNQTVTSTRIEVVSAGAGSGKTYRLATEVYEAIRDEEARPEGVLLTTFTRKAAAELEERVRVRLFEKGHREAALRVRRAWIGTVDSVCLQLIEEFAFELGESPKLAVLGAGQDQAEFNRALSDTVTKEDGLRLYQLGWPLSLYKAPNAEWDWRVIVKDIADAARANRMSHEDLERSGDQSVQSYLSILPPPGNTQEIEQGLLTAIDDGIDALEDSIESKTDETKGTRKALSDLREFGNKVRRDASSLKWCDWAALSKLKTGKKSESLVEGVRTAASRHLEHPRLRRDVEGFTREIFDIAARGLACYQERKRDKGVLDYIDLEERCLQLLSVPSVRESLRSRLDLVLVDEFQDTSPIQLALFLQLAGLAKRSVWVGDPKQCIFEFRGADPVLMESVLKEVGLHDRLEKSYRSRPDLVEFVNDVFRDVFPRQGIHEIELDSVRKNGQKGPALQSWILPSKGGAPAEATALAQQIDSLLQDSAGHCVVDKKSGEERRLEPRDVCLLARTNGKCVRMADAIARRGLPVDLARPDLLECPEVIFALAAYRLLLDPGDALAAAELTFLRQVKEDGHDAWLERRLKARFVEEGEEEKEGVAGAEDPLAGFGGDPVVQALIDQSKGFSGLSPAELLHRAFEISEVTDVCCRWGSVTFRLANLEQLVSIAREYQEQARGRGESSSATGLLAHLRHLGKQEEDEQATGGSNAVRISTYHRAKGLEWPWVVLTELGNLPQSRIFEPAVMSAGEFQLADPLADRWIRYWPWPFANHRKDLPMTEVVRSLPEKEEAEEQRVREATRLLYVGMTRARDCLIFVKKKAAKSRKNRDTDGAKEWLEVLEDEKGVATFELPQADGESDFEVVDLVPGLERPIPLESVRWFAGVDGRHEERAPAVLHASSLASSSGGVKDTALESVEVGERMQLRGDVDMQSLGNAVHGYLGVDVKGLSEGEKEEISRGLLEHHGVVANGSPRDVVLAGDRFRSFVEERWPGAQLHREWPVALRRGDQEVRGTADLVVELEDGFVVIDHKTFPGGREEMIEKAKGFGGQLEAYRKAVGLASGKRCMGTWVHFPVAGWMVEVGKGSEE